MIETAADRAALKAKIEKETKKKGNEKKYFLFLISFFIFFLDRIIVNKIKLYCQMRALHIILPELKNFKK